MKTPLPPGVAPPAPEPHTDKGSADRYSRAASTVSGLDPAAEHRIRPAGIDRKLGAAATGAAMRNTGSDKPAGAVALREKKESDDSTPVGADFGQTDASRLAGDDSGQHAGVGPFDGFNSSQNYAVSLTPPAAAGTGLLINLLYDAQALAAPQSFRNSIQAAANLLQAAIGDNITFNVRIGYGEIDGRILTSGSAEGGPSTGVASQYQNLRTLLASHATSAADAASVDALPNTSSLDGQSSFFVPNGEAKVLGLVSPNSSAQDGTAGFAADIPSTELVGVALHEITHAMGRIVGNSVMSLFRYNSQGVHVFSDNLGVSSFFSIDGATTKLADFGTSSDVADFLNPPTSTLTPHDPFDEFYDTQTLQSLTAVDLTMLDVLGYQIACYALGTLIRTPTGEVPVEALAIGDFVMTMSGTARRIKWIGRRSYAGPFVAGNRSVLPIRISAGALADGLPARDVRVSPEHAIYLDGVLTPARQLANGLNIRQETAVERVDYFHIELETHDIVFAEGVPAETYVDCDNRRMFHNAAEFSRLYPGDARPEWQFCAPRTAPGSDAVETIRRGLFARAAVLGYATTADPDPRLIVDGESVLRRSFGQGVHRFTIPAGGGSLWLASRSAVPAEILLSSPDDRRLGVAVTGIVLRDAQVEVAFGPGASVFGEGFHACEAGYRWSDGMGRLNFTILDTFPAEVTLELYLAEMPMRYPLEPALPARPRRCRRRPGAAMPTASAA